MNRDYVIIFGIIGIVLYALEYYSVRKKGLNKWIIPVITWVVTLIIAIPFSVTFGAFASFMQIICLLVFEIEDWFKKNKDKDKMKIKNL